MTQESLGLLIALQSPITAKQFESILQYQMHPIFKHCSIMMILYSRMIMSSHTLLHKYKCQEEIRHLQRPPESPDLNINKSEQMSSLYVIIQM